MLQEISVANVFFNDINLYKVIFHQMELEVTDSLYVSKPGKEFL